ncbi:hypothetical protein LR48_Vigan09g061300 [Vigna angularis]|uniref:Microtubule-associated protein MAP65-1a n=1 Tax=Phaseolus angularis TaxID=3914 RepID=A0A0L9VBF0_PHAAN|nr:hypothetical protein LR48_Vigan09g061300 [Vigna angularis]
MAAMDGQNPLLDEITCGSLLYKLQEIWDEVGESDEERDKMLLQIEEECLDVYKRKVEMAAKSRARLLQSLSDAKLELSSLLLALGENSFTGMPDKTSGTIKEQLAAIAPILEQLWQQKEERVKEFSDVQLQIEQICGEITGDLNPDQTGSGSFTVDESDLSLKKLDEYQAQFQELQREKSERLQKVLEYVSTVHDLCAVLGMDFFSIVTEVHPSLNDAVGVHSKSISNGTLAKLAKTVSSLKEDKKQRLHKLQELASQLIDLWNLMDTPTEERRLFDHVTCNISASVDEVTVPGALALDLIEQAEVEVERLDQLKASKMKEIAFKKQDELEEIYARAHVEINPEAARGNILSLIDSGNIEPSELLTDMDNQIAAAKEEALSRKEILDKVEKWMSACEEESWLEDYNRDENRYSASRGAHINLKRAEKARILLQELASQLIDLWNLMDTPTEERRLFDHVTCNISASVDEVTVPGALALDLIEQAEVEVERLDQLKASKMKEIAFKKQDELEEIYARAHVEINPEAARGNILSLIDSGNIEPSELLTDMDNQIAAAKEEALSRKEILDKVEKWMSACEEESWLEDYNRDENRYSASRGAHINLKRAEKARILVSKIPALVDTLVAKTRTWEEVHNMSFTYDGVPLLAMLDEYAMLRHERQEEKRRMRASFNDDQKKYYEQQTTDQESVFGSRPSPARPLGNKKVVGPRPNGTPNRRLSLNAHQNGSRSTAKDGKRDNTRPVAPLNYVSMSKEDAASHVSGTEPVPTSP